MTFKVSKSVVTFSNNDLKDIIIYMLQTNGNRSTINIGIKVVQTFPSA